MRAERVIDRSAAHLEVAVYLILSRNGGDHCFRPRLPQPFVVEKEKTLIANDWTTKRAAEVIAHEMVRLIHLVEGASVEGVVAQELIRCSVKLIPAGTCHNVDLPTACAADLSRIASRLDFELLNTIGRRTEVECIERGISVGCSVKQEIVCVRTIATDAHGRALAGTPVEWTHVAGLSSMRFMRSGHSKHEIDEHAAVQGKILDRCRFDHFANGGISRFQKVRRIRSYIYDTGVNCGDLEREVNCASLTHFECHLLSERSKS